MFDGENGLLRLEMVKLGQVLTQWRKQFVGKRAPLDVSLASHRFFRSEFGLKCLFEEIRRPGPLYCHHKAVSAPIHDDHYPTVNDLCIRDQAVLFQILKDISRHDIHFAS